VEKETTVAKAGKATPKNTARQKLGSIG